jgi:hypothetical protein
MFTLDTTKEEVLSDFPGVENWIKFYTKIKNKELNEKKVEFYFTFGFFHAKTKNKEEFYLEMYEKSSNMMYEDRLKFELSKVRVNLTMKIGHFVISDRMPKGIIPKVVNDVVAELTKVKMLIESEWSEDDEIKNSIPEIDKSVISFEIIKDYVKSDSENLELDVDEILDKIANSGMDSLSDEEKDFLDKKSKEM